MNLNTSIGEFAAFADSMQVDAAPNARRQIRYPLRAPVSFTWFNENGAQREAKGNSRNICEGGALISTKHCPPVGAQIILVFRFLRMPAFARFQQLEMSGRVIRTEAPPNGKGIWGFAVASAWTILQDADEQAEEPEGTE